MTVMAGSSYLRYLLWTLWDVWFSRIVVTIVIVILWDTFVQPKKKKKTEEHHEEVVIQEVVLSGRRINNPNSKLLSDNIIDRSKDDKLKGDNDNDDNDELVITTRRNRNDCNVPATTEKMGSTENKHHENDDNNEEKSSERNSTTSIDPSNSNDNDENDDGDNDNDNDGAVGITTATTTTDLSLDASAKTQSKSKSPLSSSSVLGTATATTAATPRIKSSTNKHPGLNGFSHWYEVETSLYRIYTLTRNDGIDVVPPYVPHSYRGNVSIFLHITNETNHTINVYWVDYKGKHIQKGQILSNQIWTQTTWIDHPWVFENALDSTPYLYYVPYRVIPTLPTAPTVGDDNEMALHKFKLIPPEGLTQWGDDPDPFYIGIQDDIMPFPAMKYLNQPLYCINWTLKHMIRNNIIIPYSSSSYSIDLLQIYLTNIMNHPDQIKYRQIRISNPKFQNVIWDTPMKGLLLAVGFIDVGPFAELGCHDEPLSSEWIQDIALLSFLLNEWKNKNLNATTTNNGDGQQQEQRQPPGATDGFGRAGFGRAGTIN